MAKTVWLLLLPLLAAADLNAFLALHPSPLNNCRVVGAEFAAVLPSFGRTVVVALSSRRSVAFESVAASAPHAPAAPTGGGLWSRSS